MSTILFASQLHLGPHVPMATCFRPLLNLSVVLLAQIQSNKVSEVLMFLKLIFIRS
jgi:hypothetical protein